MESSPDTKVVSVMQTLFSRAMGKGSRSASFYSAVEEELQNCAPEPLRVDTVAAKLIDAPLYSSRGLVRKTESLEVLLR